VEFMVITSDFACFGEVTALCGVAVRL